MQSIVDIFYVRGRSLTLAVRLSMLWLICTRNDLKDTAQACVAAGMISSNFTAVHPTQKRERLKAYGLVFSPSHFIWAPSSSKHLLTYVFVEKYICPRGQRHRFLGSCSNIKYNSFKHSSHRAFDSPIKTRLRSNNAKNLAR